MQRVTITIDDELMTELDRIIEARGYQNRSEAIRDLARAGIRQAAETIDKHRDCVAALVYVYDHHARQLAKRLADTFHDHHELSLASMHAHLDHDNCMEVTILRGKADRGAALRRARDRRARRAPRPCRAGADRRDDQAAHPCGRHHPQPSRTGIPAASAAARPEFRH